VSGPAGDEFHLGSSRQSAISNRQSAIAWHLAPDT
jgi:hypothetical protein